MGDLGYTQTFPGTWCVAWEGGRGNPADFTMSKSLYPDARAHWSLNGVTVRAVTFTPETPAKAAASAASRSVSSGVSGGPMKTMSTMAVHLAPHSPWRVAAVGVKNTSPEKFLDNESCHARTRSTVALSAFPVPATAAAVAAAGHMSPASFVDGRGDPAGRERVGPEGERDGDAPGRPTAAAERPPQIWVGAAARDHELAVGGHDLGRKDVVDTEPERIAKRAVPARQAPASHPDGDAPALRNHPAVVGRGLGGLGERGARAEPDAAGGGPEPAGVSEVPRHVLEQRGPDQNGARAFARVPVHKVVPGAEDRDAELVRDREPHALLAAVTGNATNCGELAERGEFRVAAMQMSRLSASSGWQGDGSDTVSLA